MLVVRVKMVSDIYTWFYKHTHTLNVSRRNSVLELQCSPKSTEVRVCTWFIESSRKLANHCWEAWFFAQQTHMQADHRHPIWAYETEANVTDNTSIKQSWLERIFENYEDLLVSRSTLAGVMCLWCWIVEWCVYKCYIWRERNIKKIINRYY